MDAWHPQCGRVRVDGYMWLPRMLEKARAAHSGELGDFLLFEASPLDAFVLRRLKVTGAQITGWLDEGLDDGAIAQRIAALAGHADLAAREAWSDRLAVLFTMILLGLDAEEGRLAPGPLATWFRFQQAVAFKVVSFGNRLRGVKPSGEAA